MLAKDTDLNMRFILLNKGAAFYFFILVTIAN